MKNMYNVVLISMDAVRPDHLTPYGYKKANTPNINYIAKEGSVFENATASSCLTPVAHGSMLTGNNPPAHNVRDPFSYLETTMVSEKLKEFGYSTAGFVAVGFLSAVHGFGKGFDYYNEPSEEKVWSSKHYVSEDEKEEMECLQGNMWRDDMFNWLREHKKEKFFIFGHYFEVHWGMEKEMLKKGLIKKDYLPEFNYYDAKIEYMDNYLIGPLIELLKDLGIWENTIIALTSDHGENLGEHEVPPPFYPQHRTLYECDMRIPLIIKSPNLPKNKRIKGLVRTIDIAPTIYDILNIKDVKTDGQSLVEFIEKGKAEGLLGYSEELYSRRGFGDFQAIKSDTYKYIIDHRSGKEEFYNIKEDPDEKNNLIDKLTEEQRKLKQQWKNICVKYFEKKEKKVDLSDEQKKKIEARLKALGYKGFDEGEGV